MTFREAADESPFAGLCGAEAEAVFEPDPDGRPHSEGTVRGNPTPGDHLPLEAAASPRQAQGRRRGEQLSPLGAAVDGTVFVRIGLAPCPIPAVPLHGARGHAQHEHGPQCEHCQSLLHALP